MLINYLLIAIRRLKADLFYSTINILGLAIGMAVFVFTLLYVQDELSFDKNWKNSGQIFRLETVRHFSDKAGSIDVDTFPAIAPALVAGVAEVEQAARLVPMQFVVKYQEKAFYENINFIDKSFLSIFGFEFIYGDYETAFGEPFSIVITKSMSEKYFGDINPVDKVLTLDNKNFYRVGAVIKDVKENSHLNIEFLANIQSRENMYHARDNDNWKDRFARTYILLKKNETIESLKNGIEYFSSVHIPNELNIGFRLNPIEDIHLQESAGGGGNSLIALSLIGGLILLIACINATNMAIAKGVGRNKELGVRKSLGASRQQLAIQFLSESLVLSVCALFLAIILVRLSLGWFNYVTDKTIIFDFFTNIFLIWKLVIVTVITGFIAGSYPAFYLSKFQPSEVFRNLGKAGSASSSVRNGLIIVQFSIAIVVSIYTVFIFQQMSFIKKIDLGFEKENILVLSNLGWTEIKPNYERLKNELLKNPEVISVSGSMTVPGKEYDKSSGFYLSGGNREDALTLNRLAVDYDFFETYNINVLAGRSFGEDYALDRATNKDVVDNSIYSAVINESAARKLGWLNNSDALGQLVNSVDSHWNFTLNIVGVVSDFHMLAGHGELSPYIFIVYPEQSQYLSVKITGNNLVDTLESIDSTWSAINPNYPIVRSFLDTDLNIAFSRWEKNGQIMAVLSIVAIVIAMLGSFVLSGFSIRSQTKEIGLRKMVGANTIDISRLFLWKFAKPVLIANIIAMPIAFYVVIEWLSGFPYRLHVSSVNFLVVSVLSLVVCWIAVGYHIIKISNVSLAHTFRNNHS
ncbi:ABC transporter permease [Cellvibrio mixtus]|uniref:ABC transporter permease n=1 Tax=Cellvibrio mixtus TaxID=39650 RepID=UPI000587D2E9|nr:ABC transporter permease [Cellvibrio mixtus]